MNKFVILAAVSIFSSALWAEEWSKSGWENAFSRRNYILGMSLTAFKTERFPDGAQIFQDPGNREIFPLCSNEQEPQHPGSGRPSVYVPGDLRKAGVVVCRYYYHYSFGDSPYHKKIKEAELLVAEWGTSTAFYFIKPQGADDYFLYQIESTSPQRLVFNEILETYTAANGPPNIETRPVQNRLGAKFDNIIASWTNEVSTIRIEKYYTDLDTYGIVLTLTPLDEILRQRMTGVVLERAKRL